MGRGDPLTDTTTHPDIWEPTRSLHFPYKVLTKRIHAGGFRSRPRCAFFHVWGRRALSRAVRSAAIFRSPTMQTPSPVLAPVARVLPSDDQLLALANASPRHLPVVGVTARTADGKRFARVVVRCECGAERECASQDLFQVKGCFSCQTRSQRTARKGRTKARVASLRSQVAELEAKLAAVTPAAKPAKAK